MVARPGSGTVRCLSSLYPAPAHIIRAASQVTTMIAHAARLARMRRSSRLVLTVPHGQDRTALQSAPLPQSSPAPP